MRQRLRSPFGSNRWPSQLEAEDPVTAGPRSAIGNAYDFQPRPQTEMAAADLPSQQSFHLRCTGERPDTACAGSDQRLTLSALDSSFSNSDAAPCSRPAEPISSCSSCARRRNRSSRST
jgi:hypothetical protein